MSSVNKVILVGNLGRDPELSHLNNDRAVARLNVATTRRYTSGEGEVVEETEWHRVSVWGKQAESCDKYLSKGRQVYVEGRLKTSSYEDKKDGIKRYTTEIIADNVQFLGSRDGKDDGGRGRGRDDDSRGRDRDDSRGRDRDDDSRGRRRDPEPEPQDSDDDFGDDW